MVVLSSNTYSKIKDMFFNNHAEKKSIWEVNQRNIQMCAINVEEIYTVIVLRV